MEQHLKINDYDFKIFSDETIDEKNINLIYTPIEKKFSKEAQKFIDNNWQKVLAKNPEKIYDGDLVELIKIEKVAGKLNIYYDYTKYSYTVATRSKDYKIFAEQGNYRSNHIAIPTLIRAADNKVLIGSDLAIKNNMQTWKFPGGHWEKCCEKISDNVRKECCEELGNIKVGDIKIIGISACNNLVSIVTSFETSMTSSELLKYIREHRNEAVDAYEMAEIKFIDVDENRIKNLLSENLLRFGSTTTYAIHSIGKLIRT